MIQPYLDFQDRIKGYIFAGWKLFNTDFMSKDKEEQAKSKRVDKVWNGDTRLRYCTLKAFHLKVKNDGIYILHLILMYCELWVCDVVERGIEGVYCEFH